MVSRMLICTLLIFAVAASDFRTPRTAREGSIFCRVYTEVMHIIKLHQEFIPPKRGGTC